MRVTTPNIITAIRLAAIPFMAYYIYLSAMVSQEHNLTAFVLFAAIWATDVLDGFIARRFNLVSNFGKLFDPFVDKLFQFVTALMMSIVGRLPYWVPIVIFCKEILLIIGGAVLLKKYSLVVYSRWYGKLATFLFVVAFSALFFVPADWQPIAGMKHITGLFFVPPIILSFTAYFIYYFDNIIPILFKRSKRRLNAEIMHGSAELSAGDDPEKNSTKKD